LFLCWHRPYEGERRFSLPFIHIKVNLSIEQTLQIPHNRIDVLSKLSYLALSPRSFNFHSNVHRVRVFDNVKKHEFALRSVMMDVMRQTVDADLSKPDFRKELAVRLRDAMNSLLEKYEDFGGIEDVYFTSFIVQ